jgi:hypothetical protein
MSVHSPAIPVGGIDNMGRRAGNFFPTTSISSAAALQF